MIFVNDFLYILPEVYLAFGLLFVLLYGSLLEKNNNGGSPINYVSKSIPTVCLVLLAILYKQPRCDVFLFNFLFESSHLSSFSKSLILVLFLFLSLLFIDYYRKEQKGLASAYEPSLIMLLSILGMFVLVSVNDFIILFLGIELLSLGLYILAASKRQVVSSLEAGLKYFVLGAFSSGILLLGISLIYGSLGMTNFSDIKYFFVELDLIELRTYYVFLVGFCFVTVGLFFKLAAAPFHSWAPDVYSGAPTFVTAFFSIIPKISILVVVVKLYYNTLLEISCYWSFFLIFCSLASLLVGCLGAIFNLELKRLMAYGTINHLGFILLSLSTVSVEGLQASFFYLTVYLLLNLNFFSILLAFRKQGGSRVLRSIKDFSTVLYVSPLVSIFLVLNLFSMAGVPPLAGFFSKFYVLYSAMTNSMYLMSVVALCVSAASCFYYIRMVKSSMFEAEAPVNVGDIVPTSLESAAVTAITSFFNLLFFLNPSFLLSLCYNIAYKIFL